MAILAFQTGGPGQDDGARSLQKADRSCRRACCHRRMTPGRRGRYQPVVSSASVLVGGRILPEAGDVDVHEAFKAASMALLFMARPSRPCGVGVSRLFHKLDGVVQRPDLDSLRRR
jgi:hypothetical protein